MMRLTISVFAATLAPSTDAKSCQRFTNDTNVTDQNKRRRTSSGALISHDRHC